jgi:hypothetical protein
MATFQVAIFLMHALVDVVTSGLFHGTKELIAESYNST